MIKHDIGIVIVNYNVRHFLMHCLQSIRYSQLHGLNLDVWVVDNASVDGSVSLLKSEYPEVNLIANEKNVGFSAANNQAIKCHWPHQFAQHHAGPSFVRALPRQGLSARRQDAGSDARPRSRNKLQIEDRKASRLHARIVKRKDGYFLVDTSTNGTFVCLTGKQEVLVRRHGILLEGSGNICFGTSRNDPAADAADFEYL